MDIRKYISSGIIEDYVLGFISDTERAEVDRMRSLYPEIEEAILDYEEDLEKYSSLHAVQPPEDLKSAVMASLRDISEDNSDENTIENPISETKTNTKAETEPLQKRVSHKLIIWKRIAVAAVILFIISAGLNGYLLPKYKNYKHRYIALIDNQEEILAQNKILKTRVEYVEQGLEALMNPNMEPVKMDGVNAHKDLMATVFWNTKNQQVFLGKMNLPVPPSGKAYQLWAIVDGNPISLGMYNPKDDKEIKEMKNISSKKIQAFAITLEVAKGSDTPTMDQMYVMGSPS